MKIKFFNRNVFKLYDQISSKRWITLLLVIGGLVTMYGCTYTTRTTDTQYGSIATTANVASAQPARMSVKPDKFDNLKSGVNEVKHTQTVKAIKSKANQVGKTQDSARNTNCTIRQYAAKKMKSERFYCEVEGNDKLTLYVKPDENSIAWLDFSKQVYVFNHEQVNSILVVNGKVKVNKNNWEFVPQRNPFLVGPKRVEVVLDQR